MIGMGFLPSRNVTRQEDLIIAASSNGAGLDAIAVVGQKYQLLGTTTRAQIALLECATVGPVTWRLRSPIAWGVADGDEFSGVLKPAALGAATFSWGAAPNRGLIANGDGSIEIQGLIALSAIDAAVRSWARVVTATLTAANAAWVGFTRAADKTLMSFGGLGANATPQWRAACGVGQSVTTPTLTVGTVDFGTPSTARHLRLICNAEAYGASNTGTIAQGSIKDPGGASSTGAAANATWGAGVSDRIIVLGGRGVVARHVSTEIILAEAA